MIKIQIKSRYFGSVLFEYEKENNTIKDTLIEAVKTGADLKCADLKGADLTGADLTGADLKCAYLKGADLTGADLTGAYLTGADLTGADLKCAYLTGAYLTGAYLTGADLTGADLTGADLTDAYLKGADLTGADLTGAYLTGAYLTGADLTGADLKCAYLTGAYLTGADFTDAKEIPYVSFACPSDGAFIGWKKVCGNLIKLEIPEDARRCSATSQKCRCDKAKVLSVWNMRLEEEVSEVVNHAYNQDTLYKVGEMVYPDSFDEDRWNECSHGIHFFINKQDAINY